MSVEMKNCPHCDFVMEDDGDTFYPVGSWEDTPNGRVYGHYLRYSNKRYNIWCNISSGGCGTTVYGDSEEETLKKWNTRFDNDCKFCDQPEISLVENMKSAIINTNGYDHYVKKGTPGSSAIYTKVCKCGVELGDIERRKK